MSTDSTEPLNTPYPSYDATTPPGTVPPSAAPPYDPTSDTPVSAPELPYPTNDSPAGAPTLPYPTTDPATTAPAVPYPTSNPPAEAPALPYPTSDPAYPPPATNPQTEETSSMLPGNGTTQNEGGKPVELPAYSDPPPSYMDTFPEMQPPQPPQPTGPSYPPAGYASQYTAPQPQEMIRVHGSAPFRIECPKCRQEVVTRVSYVSGMLTYLIAFVCILFGGIFGCCLIPFCISGLKDVYHTCPNCKTNLGRYDRLS